MKKLLLMLAGLLLGAVGIGNLSAVEFNFCKSNGYWSGQRNVKAEYLADCMRLNVVGTNPNIETKSLKVKPTDGRFIVVEYKLSGVEKPGYCRVFFATEAEPKLAEDKKIVVAPLIADGKWQKLVIHAYTNKKWREADFINRLRLDFMEKGTGTIEFRSIKVLEKLPAEKCTGWDFTGDDQLGWTALARCEAQKTSEGVKLIVTGANPYIANNNLNLDPASCSSLEITYKATGIKAPNHCRLFFGTEKNQVLDEAKKIYIGSLVCDGKWRTVTVNAENTHGGRDLWFNNGAITKLRLDFCSRNSGEFIIKSIKPIYSRATDFRNTLIKRGIPAQVPVKLGRNGEKKVEVIFDKNQDFFQSLMAAPAGRSQAPGNVLIRREFNLPAGEIQKALFQVIADDRVIEAYINGVKLDHAWSNSWQNSDCVEIEKLLKPGRNVLAMSYQNDGSYGGTMFDISVLMADDRYFNFTAEEAKAFLGKKPANWFAENFNDSQFDKVEYFPGPPNSPWTVGVHAYKSLSPANGKTELLKLNVDGVKVSGVFKFTPELKDNEVIFVRLLRPDGGMIAFISGTRNELKTQQLSDGSLKVDFGALNLPEYGGQIEGNLELGVYKRNNSAIAAQKFIREARAYPGETAVLKAVKNDNGIVARLNEKPFYFNILTINHPTVVSGQEGADSPFNVVVFRAGGMRNLWWLAPDTYDFTSIDRQLCKLIKDYPNSKLGIYVWCHPGTWYDKVYPERISRQSNGGIMRYYTSTVTFSDADVRRDATKAVSALVEHCEKYFGSKIVLYNLMGGISCEWQGWNAHTVELADYSVAARRDFAAYVAQNAPELEGNVPSRAERTRAAENCSIFRDPQRDKLSILYDQYYSESIADFIVTVADAVKKVTNNNKLVGAYYGYHMEYGNLGYCLSGGGHNALAKLLQSPSIDFLLSPQGYGNRAIGQPNSDMKPFASIVKHGKFSMLEDDTRTHVTAYDGFYHSLNADQTREIYRRNLGMQLARKMPLNHLPLVGGNDLADPSIRADFTKAVAAGQKIFEKNLPRNAEAAVVLDEKAAKLMAFTFERGESFLPWAIHYDRNGKLGSQTFNVQRLTGELIYYQRIVLAQAGIPMDYILLEDAPEAAKKYKMLILLDCFENSPELQQTFAAAREAGTHILSVYGSGFMTGSGISTDSMSQLLGMKMNIAPRGSLQLEIGEKTVGGKYEFEPRFAIDDPSVQVMANYSDGGAVAAAAKNNVTFYGGAQLDAGFIREVARRAGLHIYLESDDNLEVGCGILSLHSTADGIKVVKLTEPARLVEIFTGEVVDGSSGIARISMKALTSKVFFIEKN